MEIIPREMSKWQLIKFFNYECLSWSWMTVGPLESVIESGKWQENMAVSLLDTGVGFSVNSFIIILGKSNVVRH